MISNTEFEKLKFDSEVILTKVPDPNFNLSESDVGKIFLFKGVILSTRYKQLSTVGVSFRRRHFHFSRAIFCECFDRKILKRDEKLRSIL
jgi:hypothetical protein